jgi:hypothetical protein
VRGNALATVGAVPRKQRRRNNGQQGKQAGRRPMPKRRLAGTFDILRDAASAADAALSWAVPAGDNLARFDRDVLLRGANALKSAQLLLENMHWEFAAGPARQLFELIVNFEHLNLQADREQAALRFTKLGLLQTIRAQLRLADYERATGRRVDEQQISVLEHLLRNGYEEVRVDAKKHQFAHSWSGKTTRDLAEHRPQGSAKRNTDCCSSDGPSNFTQPGVVAGCFFPAR